MKKCTLGILSIVIFFLLSCGDKKEAGMEEKIKIGILAHTYADQHATYVFKSMEDAASKYPDLELTILDAKDDAAVQLSQVENLITTGHDGILIYTVDRPSFGTMAKLAQDAGVVMTAVNRLPDPDHYQYMDFYVGIDEKDAGIAVAEKMIEDMKKYYPNEEVQIGVVRGILGVEADSGRYEGFTNTIASYPYIKIIREGLARWERGLAITLMENWIQSDTSQELTAIFALNDEMALGAYLAAEQSGRDDIKFYSVDATPAGVEAVGEAIVATIEQDPVAMGHGAVDITYKYLKNQELPELTDDKFYFVPLNTVTEENKKEFQEKLSRFSK